MLKIFILGSCVSRDAFELAESKNYTLVNYIARTSFASAFHSKGVTNIDASLIKSNFQRRMVETDLKKLIAEMLLDTEFDYLIIDLIDERFDIYLSEDNEIFTCSPELIDNISINKHGKRISAGDDEFFQLWCKGWDAFIELARQHGFIDKIVLNKVYWTNETIDADKVVKEQYENWINSNNLWLAKLYAYIDQHAESIKITTYDTDLFLADKNHKWGLQPYHYQPQLYLEFLSQLDQIVESNEKHRLFIKPSNLTMMVNKNNPKTIMYYPTQIHDLTIGLQDSENLIECTRDDFSIDEKLIIEIELASSKSSGKKDLLYNVDYYEVVPDEQLTRWGYSKSAFKNINYFKYIVSEPHRIYKRIITIDFPKGVYKVGFSIKSFYPQGKTFVLEASARIVAYY